MDKREQLLDIMEDAAKGETRATLRARIAELEAALEPFSKFAGPLFERNYNNPDAIIQMGTSDGGRAVLYARDFFVARRTLKGGSDNG